MCRKERRHIQCQGLHCHVTQEEDKKKYAVAFKLKSLYKLVRGVGEVGE